MVKYDDDVAPTTIQKSGPKAGDVAGGNVKVSTAYRNKVELEETNLNVLMELTGAGSNLDRPGIDLVTVLDVSGSMKKEGRIDDLKIAMKFLIRKLSYIDRLSIVKFSKEASRLRPLLPMTKEAQDLIDKDVDYLEARGNTNMALGLTMALQVLNDRNHKNGRFPAIMFMSDGDPSDKNCAAEVPLGDLPVHTFAVGSDFKSNILKQITQNSKGGTFSITRVKNMPAGSSNLSDAFAKCLGGLLYVAVQNLKVTFKPFEEEIETEDGEKKKVKPTIKDVSAGLYPQTPGPDGSKTVTFYDLYKQEKRTVLVELSLPQVPENVTTSVLEAAYSYSDGNGDVPAPPFKIRIARTKENPEKERVEVIVEKKRLDTIKHMETAKGLADNNLPEARKVLEHAHKSLDAENVDDPTKLIEMLKNELRLLIESMRDEKTYNEIGRHLLDAALIAHKLQRSATVGNAQKLQMYATETMKEYLDQVKKFEEQVQKQKENPNETIVIDFPAPSLPPPAAEPPTPSPEPINPPRRDLAAVAPQITTHIGDALKSLETMTDSLKAIYDLLNNLAA